MTTRTTIHLVELDNRRYTGSIAALCGYQAFNHERRQLPPAGSSMAHEPDKILCATCSMLAPAAQTPEPKPKARPQHIVIVREGQSYAGLLHNKTLLTECGMIASQNETVIQSPDYLDHNPEYAGRYCPDCTTAIRRPPADPAPTPAHTPVHLYLHQFYDADVITFCKQFATDNDLAVEDRALTDGFSLIVGEYFESRYCAICLHVLTLLQDERNRHLATDEPTTDGVFRVWRRTIDFTQITASSPRAALDVAKSIPLEWECTERTFHGEEDYGLIRLPVESR